MNSNQIKTGTVWVYLGPGHGKNVRHIVTSVIDGVVTTWGDPSTKPEEGGNCWLGTTNDFLRHFRKADNL